MRFTIRAGGSTTGGGFAVTAHEPREALNQVRDMLARGLTEIVVVDADGTPYDLIELERITAEGEQFNAE